MDLFGCGREYFPNSQIIGIDIDPECKKHSGDGVFVHIGSQTDEQFLLGVVEKHGPFDIIIDDGGHTMNQQITSCKILFSHVNTSGMYVIEDLHTSYMSEYQGGFGKSDSTIEFLKSLIDSLHYSRHDHKNNVFDKQLFSMHFYESLAVIVKGSYGTLTDVASSTM